MGSGGDVFLFHLRWSAANGTVDSFDGGATGSADDTAADSSADPRPCDKSSHGALAVAPHSLHRSLHRSPRRITRRSPRRSPHRSPHRRPHRCFRRVSGIQLLRTLQITRSLLQHTTIDPVGFFVRVSMGRREYAVAQVVSRASEGLVVSNLGLHTCTVRCELVSNTMFSPEELVHG